LDKEPEIDPDVEEISDDVEESHEPEETQASNSKKNTLTG